MKQSNYSGGPVALVIMDGFGLAPASPGNAISLAKTPFLDSFDKYPHIQLQASGEAVGLPEGQMGNSEVGHLNIGAGRVVFQELTRINKACRDGSLQQNEILRDAVEQACRPGSALHLMGLLSDGGVHSSQDHLHALIKLAVESGVKQVFIHCFTDGRDVPPRSAVNYLQQLEDFIGSLDAPESTVSIASVSGRYYAMDRDNRWDRVQQAYQAIVEAAPLSSDTVAHYVQKSYEADVTDEFFAPTAFDARGVKNDDAVIFFNFRPDRAREISRAFVDVDFNHFDRGAAVHPLFICLTEYDPTIDAPVAFAKEFPDNVLADVLAENGIAQYHIAETEKYAHVTFFLNGGREAEKENEQRALIASPKVATYDLQPQMSEPEVAQKLSDAIDADEAQVYIVNFANCDMVGHTGSIPATIAAVEAVDSGVAQVVQAIKRKNGTVLITADHGNADKMLAEDGSPFTAHTTAPVPFYLISYEHPEYALQNTEGALCDIAPTMLDCMGIVKPAQMTGKSLLAK